MARRRGGDDEEDAAPGQQSSATIHGHAGAAPTLALPLRAPPSLVGLPALVEPAAPPAFPATLPALPTTLPGAQHPSERRTDPQPRRAQRTELPPAVTLAPATSGGASASLAASGAPPQLVVGRYQIEAPLGEGAMGQVFRVRHLQLGRPFALKLIQVGLSGSPGIRERFFREARLASQLVHPNVVSVVDFGEDDRLGAFMVMELIDGEPLSRRLQNEGRFSLPVACDIVMQIAEALHYVHAQQVVHGDIKPDNVILCRVHSTDRRRQQIKLLDFGIARVLEESRQTRSLEGTPAYISPERIRGLTPQPSMDIYSLGVVFFELLTGRLPFIGGLYEILAAHATEAPPRPSDVLGEPVDERAETLILRALEKEPAQRHRDMTAFIYELRTLMEMHGMRRRARAAARAETRSDSLEHQRQRGMQLGYELAPLAMAGVDVTGKIVVCNRAFAGFVTGDATASVEGTNVLDSPLTQICPELAVALATVARDGQILSIPLAIEQPGQGHMLLALHLVPGSQEAGQVHLYVHTLRGD